MPVVREALSLPKVLSARASVADVARLMAEARIGMVPLVDEDRLVGVITDRDLVLRVVAAGRDPETTLAAEIATTPVISVDAESDLVEAIRLIEDNQVRRLPVRDHGRVVGVISASDIARFAPRANPHDVVHTPSEPERVNE